MPINRDYTYKQRQLRAAFDSAGIHRNGLMKLLFENTCRVVSVYGDTVEVVNVTLDPTIALQESHEVNRHDTIWAWDVDNSSWKQIDIHKVKSVKIVEV